MTKRETKEQQQLMAMMEDKLNKENAKIVDLLENIYYLKDEVLKAKVLNNEKQVRKLVKDYHKLTSSMREYLNDDLLNNSLY